jgi:hypothetical protein
VVSLLSVWSAVRETKGDVRKAPGWVAAGVVALVAGVVGYMAVRGKVSRSVAFRRRYPEDRVVEFEIKLRGR